MSEVLRRNALESMEPDVLTVTSLRLSKKLSAAGVELISTEQNKQFPDRKVFLYKKTDKATRIIDNYVSERRAVRASKDSSVPVASTQLENNAHN